LALLMMITNNIGQVAFLNARLHDCRKIFFVGSFLRQNTISCKRLSYSIDFWSRGKMEALFLSHEGYFGALGTFLVEAFGDNIDKVLKVCAQHVHHHPSIGKDLDAGHTEEAQLEQSDTPDSDSNAAATALEYAIARPRSGRANLDDENGRTWKNWRPMSFSAFMRFKKEKDTPRADGSQTERGAAAAAANMTAVPSYNRSRANTETSLSSQPDAMAHAQHPHLFPVKAASASGTTTPTNELPRKSTQRPTFPGSQVANQSIAEQSYYESDTDEMSKEEYQEWQAQIHAKLASMGVADTGAGVEDSSAQKPSKANARTRGQRTMSENYTSYVTAEVEEEEGTVDQSQRLNSDPQHRAYNSARNSRSLDLSTIISDGGHASSLNTATTPGSVPTKHSKSANSTPNEKGGRINSPRGGGAPFLTNANDPHALRTTSAAADGNDEDSPTAEITLDGHTFSLAIPAYNSEDSQQHQQQQRQQEEEGNAASMKASEPKSDSVSASPDTKSSNRKRMGSI
jgi:hypothetical protein